MVDEQGNTVPDVPPVGLDVPASPQAAALTAAVLPYPGEGELALHYMGEETIQREGVTFAPDAVVNVPADLATRLAGRDGIRIVQETAEGWPNFLAMRARLAGVRAG